MAEESLEDLLRRLEREREDADRLYGAALTALDRSLQVSPELPPTPAPYDAAQIHPINLAWNILPDGPPAIDRSLKGRLRGFIWRLVGPAIEKQHALNAALVDHLNRNVAAHAEASEAIRQAHRRSARAHRWPVTAPASADCVFTDDHPLRRHQGSRGSGAGPGAERRVERVDRRLAQAVGDAERARAALQRACGGD